MTRFHCFKDSTEIGSASTHELAVALIRAYQEQETHYLLRSSYSIIEGEEEFIPYPEPKKTTKRRKNA